MTNLEVKNAAENCGINLRNLAHVRITQFYTLWNFTKDPEYLSLNLKDIGAQEDSYIVLTFPCNSVDQVINSVVKMMQHISLVPEMFEDEFYFQKVIAG